MYVPRVIEEVVGHLVRVVFKGNCHKPPFGMVCARRVGAADGKRILPAPTQTI
jgi:hypothetical protein